MGDFTVVDRATEFDAAGLYYKEQYISDIVPILQSICITKKGRYSASKREFEVQLKRYGEFGEHDYGTKKLVSLQSIPYFDLFSCPDGLLGVSTKKCHIQKLQEEALCCKSTYNFTSINGLIEVEGKPVYLFMNEIITPDEELNKLLRVSNVDVIRGKTTIGEDLSKLLVVLPKYMNFIPNVTEILFYSALAAPVKELLLNMNICQRGFMTMIVGEPGHLKTTLAENMFLWCEQIDKQKRLLMTRDKMPQLKHMLVEYSGLNFLLDDIHSMHGYYEKNKQENRLDEISRWITEDIHCANIVLTGESFINMGITSCLDRILQVKIPKMSPQNLNQMKSKMSEWDRDYMPTLARQFIIQIMTYYEEVLSDIKGFFEREQNVNADSQYRIYSHGRIIRLVEYLFCKYMCYGDETISGRKNLEVALEYQRQIQEKEMQSIDADENTDYLFVLCQLLFAEEQNIIEYSVDDYYAENAQKGLYCEGRFYFTRDVLCRIFAEKLNRKINMKIVKKQLVESNLLLTDSTNVYKKFKSKNHFVFAADQLFKYYNTKKMENIVK